MILLLTILSFWPSEWYQEYSDLNWDNMEQVSSDYEKTAINLAAQAISQYGTGSGNSYETAIEAILLDSTDHRTWTALAFVGMQPDSFVMDSLFSIAFDLVDGVDPVLSETYSYWLLSVGNCEEAYIHASEAVEADSTFGPGWLTLSMALVDCDRIDEALAVSQEAVRRLPDCNPLKQQYGQVLSDAGDPVAAISVFREVIQRDSTKSSTYSALGLLLEENKRTGEAIKVYRELLKFYPQHGWAWSRLAVCLLEEQRPDLADSFFQKSIEFSPDNSWTLYQLAKLRITSDPVSAQELLERAVELDPMLSAGWQELAFLYEAEDNLTAAEFALQRAIEIEPEPWLYGELGWVLEAVGSFSEAADAYETSISIDPQYLYGWQRRGDLFSTSGETEAAWNWYKEACLALEQQDSWILGELAGLAVAEARIDSAEAYFVAALAIDPDYSLLWLNLTRVYRIKHQTEDALLSLEEYLYLSEDSAVSFAEKIFLLEAIGENTDSITMEMLDLFPDAWIAAGWSAYDNSYNDLAFEFAERAFHDDSNTAWQLIHLAELFGVLDMAEKRRLCYHKTSLLETDDYHVTIRLADYYYGEDLSSVAIEILLEAYNTYEWNETLTTALAEAYLFNDQLDKAEELLLQVMQYDASSVYTICYLGLIEENRGNLSGALDQYLEALRLEPGYAYAESRLRFISSDNYDAEFQKNRLKPLNWNFWIDLSSTGGNNDEQYYGGGGSVSFNYGQVGSSVSFEANARSEIRNEIDIRKSAWASISAEHFITNHLYAGASSSWDRQPITVRPWQVSSYLAAGWKSWPASWIWIAPETGAGLVNTRWSTDQGRTDELTAYASFSTWASSSVSWLPSLWLSGSVYLPPKNTDGYVADATGELEFDLPGRISLVVGTSLDYTNTPVVESWEKLDSEVYVRLRF